MNARKVLTVTIDAIDDTLHQALIARFDDLVLDVSYEGEHGTHRLIAGRVLFDDADDLYGVIDVDGNHLERLVWMRPDAWRAFADGLVTARARGASLWTSRCLVSLGQDAPLMCSYDAHDEFWVGSSRDVAFKVLSLPVIVADALATAIVARRLPQPTSIRPFASTLYGTRP